MTPAVATSLHLDLPKAVPGHCWCERRATMDGAEQMAVVTPFSEFLMSQLHPSPVCAQNPSGDHGLYADKDFLF